MTCEANKVFMGRSCLLCQQFGAPVIFLGFAYVQVVTPVHRADIVVAVLALYPDLMISRYYIYRSTYVEELGTRPMEAALALNGCHSVVGVDHLAEDP